MRMVDGAQITKITIVQAVAEIYCKLFSSRCAVIIHCADCQNISEKRRFQLCLFSTFQINVMFI